VSKADQEYFPNEGPLATRSVAARREIGEEVYDPRPTSLNKRFFYTGADRIASKTEISKTSANGNQGLGLYGSSRRRVADDYAHLENGGTSERVKPGIVSAYRYQFSERGVIDLTAAAAVNFERALLRWVRAAAVAADSDRAKIEEKILSERRRWGLGSPARSAANEERPDRATNQTLLNAYSGVIAGIANDQAQLEAGKEAGIRKGSTATRHFENAHQALNQIWLDIARENRIQALTLPGAESNARGVDVGAHQVVVLLDMECLARVEVRPLIPVEELAAIERERESALRNARRREPFSLI